MATEVIQTFLTRRLFDVGGDDGRVVPLRQAAEDVAALIKAAPQRSAIFTMVAIDSAIAKDEPVIGEIMKILERHWSSYAGAFADPVLPTVARAILLDALAASIRASEPVAAAVSLTARNMLPHLGDAADYDLWAGIVAEADKKLARRAEREWALPSASAAVQKDLSFAEISPVDAPTVNKTALESRLAAAAGPQTAGGEAIANANPHWPNEGADWSFQFAPRASAAIAAIFDAASKALAQALSERADIEGMRTAVSGYVTDTVAALTQTALGLERRTALLWWKEALHSPAAGLSYRDLAPSGAAALAALDAIGQAGPFAPRMAEAVLGETLRAIEPTAMLEPRSLLDHVEAVKGLNDGVQAVLKAGYAQIHSARGRSPLGALILSEDMVAATIADRLGLDAQTKVSAMEFGVWLYRDLQAAVATPEPFRRKKSAKTT